MIHHLGTIAQSDILNSAFDRMAFMESQCECSFAKKEIRQNPDI